MTASSSGCTPLFLKALPQRTGTKSWSMVAVPDRRLDLVGGDLQLLEVLLEQLLVGLGGDFEHLAPPLLGCAAARRGCRWSPSPCRRRPSRCGPSSRSDRRLRGIRLRARSGSGAPGVGPEPVDDRLDIGVEVGAGPVELVDEADARDLVAVGLAPHRLRLRLDAGDAVEHRDRAVEDPEAALDFDREIDVAGECR